MEQTQAEHDAAIQHVKESNALRDALLKALSGLDGDLSADLADKLCQAGLKPVADYFVEQTSIAEAAKGRLDKINEALQRCLEDQRTAVLAAHSAVDIMAHALEHGSVGDLLNVKSVLGLSRVGEPAKPFDKHAKRYGLRTKVALPYKFYSTKTFKEGGMSSDIDEADRLDLETANDEKLRLEKAGWSLEIFEFDDLR